MPELEQKEFQKRQVAYKARISDILNAGFAKDEFSAGYIKLDDVNVSRVSIIANVVYKPEQQSDLSAVIDDGSGKILLRSFENNGIFSKADVGDFVLVIGKVREFGNERYVMPEIFKKISDIGWVNVRKAELKGNKIAGNKIENNEAAIEDLSQNAGEEIYLIVKSLDKGDGAAVDEVIKSSKSNDAEGIINRMLANGDIFEIKPGMLKVLE